MDTTGFVDCIKNLNPSYDVISNNAFSLEANSPCIGAGKNTSLLDDYYCNPHNNPFDIGAVAYQN
jgi:hypothetical protein